MDEAVIILGFVLIIIVNGLKNAKKIIFKARTNYVRMTMAVIVSVMIVILFWSQAKYAKLELISIILLILFCGFAPEGLGNNQVFMIGSLNSNLAKYQKIELEPEDKNDNFTRIHFYIRKNNSTCLVIKGSVETTKKYFLTKTNCSDKVQVKS